MQNEPFFHTAGRNLYSLLQGISIVSAILRVLQRERQSIYKVDVAANKITSILGQSEKQTKKNKIHVLVNKTLRYK